MIDRRTDKMQLDQNISWGEGINGQTNAWTKSHVTHGAVGKITTAKPCFSATTFREILVGRLSILGQRKSCGPRARPRIRDEGAEITARSCGFSFLNSQLEINTYNSPPSRSTSTLRSRPRLAEKD